MTLEKNPKNLLIRWIIITILAIFCLYWESRLYFYLSHFVNGIKANVPYDPLFHLLPAINFYGLLKIGLPLTFLFALIGLFRKFYQLPYLLFMSGLWWIARWTFMISVVFAIPPDRPTGSSGFFLADWLNQIIPDKIMSYDQTFMFSGHVGLPFFFTLLFYSNVYPFFSKKWFQENWLSIIFFSWSIIMAIAAVFSRSHYTIDILVAWFATYSIYRLGKKIIFKWLENLCNRLNSVWNGDNR